MGDSILKTPLFTSWRSTLAGLISFLSGIGFVISQTAYVDTKAGQTLMAVSLVVGLFGASFGFGNTKDAQVTGIGNKATTDPTKDATCPPDTPPAELKP